jgi:hypothetical protein
MFNNGDKQFLNVHKTGIICSSRLLILIRNIIIDLLSFKIKTSYTSHIQYFKILINSKRIS